MVCKCVQCREEFVIPSEGEGRVLCPHCGFEYIYAGNYLKYDFDRILFKHFKKRYLLNKVLNNNGLISYRFLKETSVSLPERQDVLNFKNYILSRISHGKILDVGCGILTIPGYLDFQKKNGFDFYGIDPIDDKSFSGMRVVGCGEFMPFQDKSFNAIIFATSLDHLCSREQALRESYRVLLDSGKIIVWMSDLRVPFLKNIKNKLGIVLKSLKEGYRVDKFIIYPNFTVLYVPDGAVDPFHFFLECPKQIVKRMKDAKFKMENMTYNSKLEVFLCFVKN